MCVCVCVCHSVLAAKIIKPTGDQALFDAAICDDAASLQNYLKHVKLADSVKTQNNSTLTHIVAARGYLGGWSGGRGCLVFATFMTSYIV